MSNLVTLLSKVQKELVAPKNRRNTFGNYNYRNCEDILEAIKRVLPPTCIIYITDNIEQIGDRFYVSATAHFRDDSGSISTTAYARESLEKKGMDSAQITGSASSYARKYALNGLFAIDDSDDSDSQDNSKEAPRDSSKPIASRLINREQEMELSKLMFDTKRDFNKFAQHYGVKAYNQLTLAQWEDAMAKCKEKLEAPNAEAPAMPNYMAV